MKSDIEIAQSVELKPIKEIAAKLGISPDNLFCLGEYIAKLKNVEINPRGKTVLVTAINPTPLGEGKTTVAIGLADALNRLNVNCSVALREPSLGPIFGVKGGAAGGGYSQVAPMADINLHFTGDLHAVTAANNLLAALIDNSVFQGNSLNIDPTKIAFTRCLDVNDRTLRELTLNAATATEPILYKSGFVITAASEIMSLFCLTDGIENLKKRLGNILVGFTYRGRPVFARELKCADALAILLKDALAPNLVQTLEGTPAFIHGGPFANVAHGCNSVIATKTALTYSDFVVTEAGFGADLGAEKFIDIKCRNAGISPSAIVLVASVRAIKFNGGATKDALTTENPDALAAGAENLLAHIKNLKKCGVPVVVAINKFEHDSERELEFLGSLCKDAGADFAVCECFAKGGAGALELAKKVLLRAKEESKLNYYYELSDSFEEKVEKLAKNIYGAASVEFAPLALHKLEMFGSLLDNLPVCIAKTQFSFSDDPKLLGRPRGFNFKISDIEYRGGAEFVVAIAGNMLRMFGLPVKPNLENMSIDRSGNIKGLF
jgi:formate--tetrahydrofolate ligase